VTVTDTSSEDATRRRLRTMFDGVAARYDAARPHYPPAVVGDLVALARLDDGSRVLEIGCGTGQLTVDLAARGVDVTAVELGPALAAVARRNLAAFPHARVVVGAFEEHPVRDPFDAIVAASAFHWVTPDARVARTAAALRAGGALAVVDVQHVLGGTEAFFTAMQDCYLRFFPGTQPGFRMPTTDEVPAAYPELDDAAAFDVVSRRRHTWEVTYTAEGFCALLSTFSNHLDLPPENRAGLLD
jgi:cyclopropane fatty-acyl-phospholipid synthase-like methyltransferase